MKKVLIPQYVPEVLDTYLSGFGYEPVNGSGDLSEEGLIRDIKASGCEAIVARTANYTKKVIEAAKGQVKIIARYGVGLDAIDVAAATENGIWVGFTPQANSSTVAEHTIGLMIACAHNMGYTVSEAKKGNFNSRNERQGQDVIGKTIGVCGFGKIGRTVGEMCAKAFGMKVLAYDPFLKPGQMPEWAELVSWEELFKVADIVTCHMPLMESTRHLIGAKEFSMMKPTAIFLNAARGGVVDEKALIAALEGGEIWGAGLDVTEAEPTEPDNPLLKMPNVTMTPHNASFTKECYDRMAEHTALCIDDALKGGKPRWAANRLN